LNDDRLAFLEAQRLHAAELASDETVRELDRALTTASDRHDFSYLWTWLGLPIIQMPTDVVVAQEVIWETQPDVIIETGVARGGSVIFFASMLQLLGSGRVIAVDLDIREHNRKAIEAHPFAHRITLVEGSSTDSETIEWIKAQLQPDDRIMVVLDSDHTHDHVLEELRRYSPLVTSGQFLVVADTLIEDLPPQEHRPRSWGPGNNPKTAVDAFLSESDGAFEVDEFINNKLLLTSSRGGYLRRR
jgi:cephalosporin hydroxylase